MRSVGGIAVLARRVCCTGANRPRAHLGALAAGKAHFAAGAPPGPGGAPQGSGPGGASHVIPPKGQRGAPGLIGPGGFPIASSSASSTDRAMGPEIELTTQNVQQVLQNPAPVLLVVGTVPEAIDKKLGKLRISAQARLPLVKLDGRSLPSIVKALQIKSEPAVLLMARGQVAAALEEDLSPTTVTAFVEKCAELMGLEVNLSESATEQLAEAEDLEWEDVAAADAMFTAVSSSPDLPQAARARATAGFARCAIWQGKAEEATSLIEQLTSSAFAKTPEVTQAVALLQLHKLASPEPSLEKLKEAVGADPADFNAAEAYTVALFWSGDEGGAFDAALAHLRKKRSDEATKLVRACLEAFGPRHLRYKKARKSFSSAVFV